MVFVISFLTVIFAAIASIFDDGGAGGSSDSGGSGSTNPPGDPGAGDGGSSDSGGSDGGGDNNGKLDEAGRLALKAERDRADREEKDRKRLEKRLADLEKAQLSEDEKKIAEAKEAGKNEAKTEMLSKLARMTLLARATPKINLKPEYIPGLFDMSEFIENDDISVAKIDAAIERILKDSPHLKVGSQPAKPGPEEHNGGKGDPDKSKYAFGHAVKSAWVRGKT